MSIRTLLIGSGSFAVPIFKKALESDFLEIVGIVTQPDRPFGRKQELRGSDVKEGLKDLYGTWFQPEKFRDENKKILAESEPELVLVASYGQILPKEFIEYPKYKTLNFHGSLLPELRGAVPVPMAILQDLKETGVTLQIMSERMDEGDIVKALSYKLKASETAGSLMDELSELGVQILEDDLPEYLSGAITPIAQDNSKATYCYKSDLARDKAEITFDTPVDVAERMVRAFNPEPIAYTKLNNAVPDGRALWQAGRQEKLRIEGMELKIFRVGELKGLTSNVMRPSLKREGMRMFLDLADGSLELLEVQLEGKKRDSALNYLYLAD